MKTYNELKKNIKKYRDRSFEEHLNIALLGDTATQFLATAIRGMGFEYGIRAEVFEAEYDSVETNVLDGSSALYAEERDFVILYLSSEKAYEAYQKTEEARRKTFAESCIDRISSYWHAIRQYSRARIIQFTFNRIDDGVFGNFSLREPSSFPYQLMKLNMLLSEKASEDQGIFLIDLDQIQSGIGRSAFIDHKFYFQARMTIGFEALIRTVKELYDVMLAVRGKIRKCLVLDLDNTLWGGVIGDDGLSGIEIGELGIGRAYTDLQKWCLELKKRGVLLAVCSKNDEETAKEPFEKHPDMILHLEDFAVFMANWEDKASNIRRIREILNIGMDSLCFVDDNPFERNLVREMIPEITVPELPEDPAEYLSYLQSLHLFETASYHAEGADRTGQYREEAERREAETSFATIDDYLKSLEMKAAAKPFDEFHYPRIAELSQRSNQFNLRTKRYTEKDIRQFAESERYLTRYFTLRDRFGDYGLISAVILEKQPDGTGFIDTWFMSCRVLKRGMEEFIINTVMQLCKEAGIKKVSGEYLRTPKNGMVSDLYERMGFMKLDDSRFEAEPEKLPTLRTYIEAV